MRDEEKAATNGASARERRMTYSSVVSGLSGGTRELEIGLSDRRA
jgi:hypothetical protein